MRAIIVAAVIAVILGAGSYFSLNARQAPTGASFTTSNVRIDPHWSWRLVSTETGAQATCEPRTAGQWFFVDFHHPAGEPALCSYSQ